MIAYHLPAMHNVESRAQNFSDCLPHRDNLQTVNIILGMLHEETK